MANLPQGVVVFDMEKRNISFKSNAFKKILQQTSAPNAQSLDASHTPNSFGSFTDFDGICPDMDLEYVYLKKEDKEESAQQKEKSLPVVIG